MGIKKFLNKATSVGAVCSFYEGLYKYLEPKFNTEEDTVWKIVKPTEDTVWKVKPSEKSFEFYTNDEWKKELQNILSKSAKCKYLKKYISINRHSSAKKYYDYVNEKFKTLKSDAKLKSENDTKTFTENIHLIVDHIIEVLNPFENTNFKLSPRSSLKDCTKLGGSCNKIWIKLQNRLNVFRGNAITKIEEISPAG